MSKITNKRTYCNRTYLTFYQKTFEQLNYLFLTQEQEDELTDEQESPHPEEGVQTNLIHTVHSTGGVLLLVLVLSSSPVSGCWLFSWLFIWLLGGIGCCD
jgi:hypothetical protein